MTGKRPTYPRHKRVPFLRQAGVYLRLLRPAPDGGSPAAFVIFAQGRTGSTLLADLMRSHPTVHCDEEILARPVVFPSAWVVAHRRRHADRHYGFKVKPYQLTVDQSLDPRRWLAEMDERGWRLIHLWRRNLLRHALSNMIAEHVGGFVFRGSPPPEARSLSVDAEMLLGTMAVREEQIEAERAALADLPHVAVCYEDDLLDPARHQATLDRLSAAIGLPTTTAKTSVRRIAGDDLRTTIRNYDEVAAAVSASPWASLLDE